MLYQGFFQNVGVITPRANVCSCTCVPGVGCDCDCSQTNEIGLMPAAMFPTALFQGMLD